MVLVALKVQFKNNWILIDNAITYNPKSPRSNKYLFLIDIGIKHASAVGRNGGVYSMYSFSFQASSDSRRNNLVLAAGQPGVEAHSQCLLQYLKEGVRNTYAYVT